MRIPRVAFFTDSFKEVNGVALTSRKFAQFARSHFYPFLCVTAGAETESGKRGSYETLQLQTSRFILPLEHDLKFDLLFARHRDRVRKALLAFKPDLVHVTGPGHMGMLGALAARDLGIPMAASWHTNIHEFGARRLGKLMGRIGIKAPSLEQGAESFSLAFAVRFYKLAKLLFAPNPELASMLAERTGHSAFLMVRGIDTEVFSPEKRPDGERPFTIGYVGRLSAEKNVRLFVDIHRELERRGSKDHRFLIVGEGSERAWLRENLPQADLPGQLQGEPLAQAYASFDAFVFPSETDTFGNVVLEAFASGAPAIVSAKGGPKFLVAHDSTGFVATNPREYADAILRLRDPATRADMSAAARNSALGRSWDEVFAGVYREYARAFGNGVLKTRDWSPKSGAATAVFKQSQAELF